MSTDYTLKMDGALPSTEVLTVLSDVLGKNGQDEWSDGAVLMGSGLLAIAAVEPIEGDYWTRESQDDIERRFGFRPKLSLNFRPRNALEGDDHGLLSAEEAHRLMKQGVFEILRRGPGDAVLLFNGESVVLERLHGRLTINEEWASWIGDGIAWLDPPAYEVRVIPPMI